MLFLLRQITVFNEPFCCQFEIVVVNLYTDEFPIRVETGYSGASDSHAVVKYCITLVRVSLDKVLKQ